MQTVAIISDQQILAQGIADVLEQTEKFEAVFGGTNRHPDMVITTKPGITEFPALAIIDDDNYVEVMALLKAGAKGIVIRNCSKEELLLAVKRIIGGGVYYCEEVQVIQLQSLSEAGATLILTSREKEILRLFCDDKTPKEIASFLGIDRKTIDSHRRNIFAKLGIHSSLELFRWATKNKLISSD